MSVKVDRWQSAAFKALMRERRIVLLAGPRQCGKTTLVRQLASDTVEYRTLDDATFAEFAESDPEGFVRRGGKTKTLIIDEVQRVPRLLPAIKKAVDEDNSPGQFILTGSANIASMPAVRESLAGRIAKVRLRPFSQAEISGAAPDFIDRCFRKDFTGGKVPGAGGRERTIETALRGGFPEAVKLKSGRARARWHNDYIAALLERDLSDIARIRRHEAMRELTRTLAAWSTRQMDVAGIGGKLGIRRPTLESYINALEALFVIERVPPWTKTDYGRVGKRSKLLMADSGLMASILGFRAGRVGRDSDSAGKLVETYVHNELAAHADPAGGKYEIYHYRDREGREIDFIIERDDGALLGVEVKAAATARKEDFKHLAWFRDNMAGKRRFVGVVLYVGGHAGSFGKGLWAVPIDGLSGRF
ncbi:MAG: ATP-binding protein [Candidatus Dadabacteria bacterium]|nr:ATP-binding protein [Candidatus Dadabacteria bacterium]